MSARPVLPHEVQQVRASLPDWFVPFCVRATGWAYYGPRWLPFGLRCLPLNLAHRALRFYVARVL